MLGRKSLLKKAVIASLTMLIVGIPFLSFQPQSSTGVYAQGQPALPIDVATKAATWIILEAVPEAGGYKWATVWGGPPGIQFYECGIYDDGTASVGTFLLELYKHTGNLTYLDYAKGAAQWIITQAIPATGGYWWPHIDGDRPVSPGWRLSPVVRDVGEFLLEMYDATGNSTYLQYAEGAGGWMVANAESESGGYFVPYNPPGKYGSQATHDISPGREARTITLLLHLYQKTLNDTYLQYVKGMAEWLISGVDIRANGSGYYWISGRPYHEYIDLDTGASIALFFYETYETLHNATYLNYANGAIQWLLTQTNTSDPSSYKWPDHVDTMRPDVHYMLIPWLNVPDRVMDALVTGYRITQNSTCLEYGKRHVNWILDQSITEGQGIKFPRWEGDLANGSAYENALIYNYLTTMYAITQNSTYLDYANKTLAWIEANATSSYGGYSWIIPESANVTATLYGASGIGYYIIHTANAHTPPIASLNYSPLSPKATETVTFNASGSLDPDGTINNYTWSFGDGIVESTTQPLATHNFTIAGNYTVVLVVTDNDSLTDTASKTLNVGKLNSTVSLEASLSEIELGQNVTITGSVSPKAVSNVTIEFRLGSASWEELSTVNAESNGAYHYSWTPEDVGLYELRGRINQDQSIQASESSAANVNVKEKPLNYVIYLGIGAVAVGILASIAYFAKKKRKP